jgi:hypothetical protein
MLTMDGFRVTVFSALIRKVKHPGEVVGWGQVWMNDPHEASRFSFLPFSVMTNKSCQ